MHSDPSFLRAWAESTADQNIPDSDDEVAGPRTLRFRTLWISDVHLGTPGCQAEALLDFLRRTESETLFLVGDITDGWQLRRSWYWPQAHNDVIQKLLRKVRKGTRVIFVPGNHDEFARRYLGHHFGGIEVAAEWIHRTADGRQLWVTHGDHFDGVTPVRQMVGAPWRSPVRTDTATQSASQLAKSAYRSALLVAVRIPEAQGKAGCRVRRRFRDRSRQRGRPTRSRWRRLWSHYRAELREIDGIVYANDGDWVESLTALAEHADGHLEILDWSWTGPAGELASEESQRPWGGRRHAAGSHRSVKIAIVSDAWAPQVNGVVTTLVDLRHNLMSFGHDVRVIEPSAFRRFRCPRYPEIELAWRPRVELGRIIDAMRRTQFTLPPRARWVSRPAVTASVWGCNSRQPFIRVSLSSLRLPRACPPVGAMRRCGSFTPHPAVMVRHRLQRRHSSAQQLAFLGGPVQVGASLLEPLQNLLLRDGEAVTDQLGLTLETGGASFAALAASEVADLGPPRRRMGSCSARMQPWVGCAFF